MRLRQPCLAFLAVCLSAALALVGCVEPAPSTGDRPTAGTSLATGGRSPAPTSRSTGPVGDDGCFDSAALGVRVRDVHIYQSVRATVIADGIAVDRPDRSVDVVADKDARVGIDIETDPGWTTREIALRVSIGEPAGPPTTWSVRTVPRSGGRNGAESLGAVVLDVPARALTARSWLSLTIVECTPVAGGEAATPATTSVDLAARRTGGIKIHLVPFQVAGFVPDTSEAVLAGYREALLAMYPVTDVDISVGDLEDGGDRPDLGTLLVTVGRIRDAERPAEDVYYYGMVTGAASRATYCDDCITGTSEAGGESGLGFAIGAAFGDRRAEDTLLHELGHAHGLAHAPCGDVDRPDAAYPYPDGVIGVPGYDRRTGMLVPASTRDVMGYCFPRWISAHNYQLLVERVAAVNGYEADP